MTALQLARAVAARSAGAAGSRLSRLAAALQDGAAADNHTGAPRRDLTGDREVEWSWCFGHLPHASRVLDFGSGNGFLSLGASFAGNDVVAVDLEPQGWSFDAPTIEYRRGDFLTMQFDDASFDHVVNCSSIEHVGLAGRYGSPDVADGDIDAMRKLERLLKPGGTMSFVAPVGRDAVFAPLHRVYGEQRLPRLLGDLEVVEEEFRAKITGSAWHPVTREVALAEEGSRSYYAIGLFLLRRR